MSEKNSSMNEVDVGDVVAEYPGLEHSDPPTVGGPTTVKSTRLSHKADGVNSLLTPQSEESPIADNFPKDSYKAFAPAAKVPPQAKVAIPRDTTKSVQPTTGRVSRACSSCRSRKVKCSGGQPSCRQCRELDLTCQYPMSWREEMRREADSNSAVVKEYQSLIRDLLDTADAETREWINTVVRKYQILQNFSLDTEDCSSIRAENAESAPSMDVNEQTPQSADQTYTETYPNVTPNKSEFGQTVTPPFQITDVKNASTFNDLPENIWERDLVDIDNGTHSSFDQKYNLPPRTVADKLFNDYLNDIHSEFPIINKQLFYIQYQNLWEPVLNPGDKWLAILNMMFAIAALYTQRRQPQWNDRDYDHLVYFGRAKLLSMTEADLFNHPSLQQIQIDALFSFYLLASEQFDKAWRISALAARAAIALASDLRNANIPNLSQREARFRLWWCVYTFEQVLGLVSCQPTSISYNRCSIPYPFQLQEHGRPETPRSSFFPGSDGVRESGHLLEDSIEPPADAFFGFSCKLAVLVEEIVSERYSRRTAPEKEKSASDLLCRIDSWRDSLPPYLNFNHMNLDHNEPHKIRLAFHFHAARIALARPWLFLRDMFEYNHTSYHMVHVAIDSARSLLELVPGELDVATLCQSCPWWCALHYITEATKAIFLELSLGCIHTQGEQATLISLAHKSIRFFEAMSIRSSRARAAWEHFRSIYRRLSFRMSYDSDMMASMMDTVSPFDLYINNGNLAFEDCGDIDSFNFYMGSRGPG